MHASERRAHKRYVIDGLLVEIDGVVHETVDVSNCAVALVRHADIDYSNVKGPFCFKSAKVAELNRPIEEMNFLYQRTSVVILTYVILEYKTDRTVWEGILSRSDVRADLVPLEDVFG